MERHNVPLTINEQDSLFSQMYDVLRFKGGVGPYDMLECEMENVYRMVSTILTMRGMNPDTFVNEYNGPVQLLHTRGLSSAWWELNCPVQMWPRGDGYRAVVYDPNSETCKDLDHLIPHRDAPMFCRQASIVLHRLASLFQDMEHGISNSVFFPVT